ncbi:hypothetical protein PR003_g28855 [Phytophthora rubi]|uniref:CCHC-type domain-containing protein n=1 Tax=Phytophthora rubi TaxID=129364 RepID=A0A6A4BWI0_9STRA|nr:hypothetical protein PR003_g28855 [Phytophthora rubi]
MKKGYIDVRGVHVWLQPSFTGRVVSNLTMNEIEYQNVNEVQPSALVQMLQGWGATDVIVVSHATNMGVRGRLPAIMCLKSVARTSPDLLFAFRLFFPSEEEATRVYANYLAARQATAHGAPETEKTTTALKPVSNVSWDRKRSEFFRPTSREYAEAAEKQVKIFGLTMEITTRKLEEAMRAHGYPAMDVLIKGPRRNWAEAEMRMKGQVDELLKEYGPDSSEKIRVGNHVLRFVRGENPQERICFQCHQPGHFRNQCPELQPKPTIGQAVRGQVGHEVAQSNTDAVTVTNSEVAMRMMKNMATQIVDERTSRLEEKLDRNMQSLAVRVDANEVQQHEVSRKMNTLAESFQQTITAAVQSAVQAAVAQVMQQGQQELQRTEPDFQRGLPSHQ